MKGLRLTRELPITEGQLRKWGEHELTSKTLCTVFLVLRHLQQKATTNKRCKLWLKIWAILLVGWQQEVAAPSIASLLNIDPPCCKSTANPISLWTKFSIRMIKKPAYRWRTMGVLFLPSLNKQMIPNFIQETVKMCLTSQWSRNIISVNSRAKKILR